MGLNDDTFPNNDEHEHEDSELSPLHIVQNTASQRVAHKYWNEGLSRRTQF